ncbi:MAG: hypothetical protein R3C11_24780 [Planctomycetaceae bacterium]
MRIVDSGAGSDAVALAVTCQVIFGSGDEPVLDAAAARLEQYHQNKTISKATGRMLGELANDAIADLIVEMIHELPRSHLNELMFAGTVPLAKITHRNSLSRKGYEQRLIRFGQHIKRAIAKFRNCDCRMRTAAKVCGRSPD